MYPLRFNPLFRRYIWGGKRLGEILGKPIGDQSAAESWEVVDHEDDQSVVQFGELAGMTLRQLIADKGRELVGANVLAQIASPNLPKQLQNRFPLLLKFLDANRHLSVQVHPDDEMGATLSPPDLGKTEAWYVMHADPGAKIFAGLKEGVTRDQFRQAIASGTTEELLHRFEPSNGDCVFIRAGTMHAIGEGLLVAEIQQASNTTFRVYDWGRVDTDGKPRDLHIEQALQATNFELGPVSAVAPQQLEFPNWQSIVTCENFHMNRGNLTAPSTLGGDGRFRILAVTGGSMTMASDPSDLPMKLADSALLPACLGPIDITPGNEGVELLEIFIPEPVK